MNTVAFRIAAGLFVGLLSLSVAACGSSSVALVEKPVNAVDQGAAAAVGKPTASIAEVRRFIARRLLEDFHISSDFLGTRRIENAKISGPVTDTGIFADKDADVYCVSFHIKTNGALLADQDIILNAHMRQYGNVLSSKFRFLKSYQVSCDPSAVPFRELEDPKANLGRQS